MTVNSGIITGGIGNTIAQSIADPGETPFNILDTTGAALFFDVDDTSTLSLTGSDANSWEDQKNGIVFTQTGSRRPVYGASSFNGIPGLDFTAKGFATTNDILLDADALTVVASILPTKTPLSATPAWQASLGVLFTAGNYNQEQVQFGYGLSGIGGETFSVRRCSSSSVHGAAGLTYQNYFFDANNEPHVLAARVGVNGTKITRHVHGLTLNGFQNSYTGAENLAPNNIGMTANNLVIGGWINSTIQAYSSNHIQRKLLVCKSYLSDAELNQVVRWMNSKDSIYFGS